jgi:hypothetical protein
VAATLVACGSSGAQAREWSWPEPSLQSRCNVQGQQAHCSSAAGVAGRPANHSSDCTWCGGMNMVAKPTTL